MKRFQLVVACLVLAACGGGEPRKASPFAASLRAAPSTANFASTLRNVRGIHLGSNGGEHAELGIQQVVPTVLGSGGKMTVASATSDISQNSFTNSQGAVVTNQIAKVRLTGVTLSNGVTLPEAGFWLFKTPDTGVMGMQFRPSVDAALAGLPGFSSDVTITIAPDGGVALPADSIATGAALQFMADAIESAPEIVLASTAVVTGPVPGFGLPVIAEGLARVRTVARGSANFQFDTVKNLNADWVAIMATMFVAGVGDPTLRVQYRTYGADAPQYASFGDDDLRTFITRARQQGLKVYLTLAIDQPFGDAGAMITPADPRCMTGQAPIPRWMMGSPQLFTADTTQCISAAHYWWAPSHPLHQANKAVFWRSYTDIAVKYARLAQETGVGLYSLGTETDWLFRARSAPNTPNHFGVELKQMVAEVRAVYGGPITYDQHIRIHTQPANFDGGLWGTYLAKDIGLDVIGLSAYIDSFASPPTSVLTVAQMEAQFWTPVFEQALKPLKAKNPTLPIMFTEFGVVPDLGAPWNQCSNCGAAVTGRDAQGITDGMRQQANLYEALFNVNERYARLVNGVFGWAHYLFPRSYSLEGWCASIGHELLCTPLASAALVKGYEVWKLADADRVFAWAEQRYPGYFPPGATSSDALGYHYRYYAATGTYLGYKDGRVIVHNWADWMFMDVGPLDTFLSLAAAAGL